MRGQWYNVEIFDLRSPAAHNTASIADTEVREQLAVRTVTFCSLQANHCHLLMRATKTQSDTSSTFLLSSASSSVIQSCSQPQIFVRGRGARGFLETEHILGELLQVQVKNFVVPPLLKERRCITIGIVLTSLCLS